MPGLGHNLGCRYVSIYYTYIVQSRVAREERDNEYALDNEIKGWMSKRG